MRGQLAKALGGRRGMAEAAVPTILFTVTWLTMSNLNLALSVSIGAALVLLVVRLVQRSTVQFVLNALFGIGIGWYFVYRAAQAGGSEQEQALAYFLPGTALQRRVRRRAGVHVPDRLAAGRLHGRQHHRRPDRMAQGQADREAVQPAHLASRRTVPAARGRAGADLAGRRLGLMD